MKRYLSFGGDAYYPSGGWEDFRGSYDTVEDARVAAAHCDWWHVVDSATGEMVAPPDAVEFFRLAREEEERAILRASGKGSLG